MQLFVIGEQSSHLYDVDMSVNGKELCMGIDISASFSIISETWRKALFPHVMVQKSTVLPLNTYTKEPIPVLGQLNVEVCYGQQQADLPLVVVGGDGPCLLGWNWLNHICLDWHEIFAIGIEEPENLEALLDKHSELFKEELGMSSSLKASLQVQPNAQPAFPPLAHITATRPQMEVDETCDRTFQQAKEALTTSQVLVHYDTTCPMMLAADASSYGVGAVISCVLADGSERPIAFASNTLTASE